MAKNNIQSSVKPSTVFVLYELDCPLVKNQGYATLFMESGF